MSRKPYLQQACEAVPEYNTICEKFLRKFPAPARLNRGVLPAEQGLVFREENYVYSSAIDYTGEKDCQVM